MKRKKRERDRERNKKKEGNREDENLKKMKGRTAGIQLANIPLTTNYLLSTTTAVYILLGTCMNFFEYFSILQEKKRCFFLSEAMVHEFELEVIFMSKRIVYTFSKRGRTPQEEYKKQ